jgi:phosphoserine aminotransferase
MCDWALFDRAPNTFHNTPDTFAIYLTGLCVQYLLSKGGVDYYASESSRKSDLLYSYIDSTDGYYVCPQQKEYRSRINVPFRVCWDDKLDALFKSEAEKVNIYEVGGFPGVGGCRANIYTGMLIEGVHALISFMKHFKSSHP